jgi:hypothetical protein
LLTPRFGVNPDQVEFLPHNLVELIDIQPVLARDGYGVGDLRHVVSWAGR